MPGVKRRSGHCSTWKRVADGSLASDEGPGLIVMRPGPSCGGGKGIRTPDLLHAMETRYQLRHTPRLLDQYYSGARGTTNRRGVTLATLVKSAGGVVRRWPGPGGLTVAGIRRSPGPRHRTSDHGPNIVEVLRDFAFALLLYLLISSESVKLRLTTVSVSSLFAILWCGSRTAGPLDQLEPGVQCHTPWICDCECRGQNDSLMF